jgi:hypothetical protein
VLETPSPQPVRVAAQGQRFTVANMTAGRWRGEPTLTAALGRPHGHRCSSSALLYGIAEPLPLPPDLPHTPVNSRPPDVPRGEMVRAHGRVVATRASFDGAADVPRSCTHRGRLYGTRR